MFFLFFLKMLEKFHTLSDETFFGFIDNFFLKLKRLTLLVQGSHRTLDSKNEEI